jgi:hypothetical protein
MPLKDHTKYYDDIGSAAPPVGVPNTVSRNLRPGDRSFEQVVFESGKPYLDADRNLSQDVVTDAIRRLRRMQVASGFLRGATHPDSYDDFILETAPAAFWGGAGGNANILADGTPINAFLLPRLDAVVAGLPVRIEYTTSHIDGYGVVDLQPPTPYSTPATIKRTDFVFLEVWLSLVAPSPAAKGTVQVVDSTQLVPGDQILIGGVPLTAIAVGPPGIDQFVIDATAAPAGNLNTAINIRDAINDLANSFTTIVAARAVADTVILQAVTRGLVGNAITLSDTAALGVLTLSGPTLINGDDRPNKPASDQHKIWRHGNVQSHQNTWLDGNMVDPFVNVESTQRIQVQYRFRATGAAEGVSFHANPDGFSEPNVLAQGGTAAPVANYPFVPADGSTTRLNSSALEYAIEDGGLWVAGDGSDVSAVALGALDGFVYAIPICMVFRHNDCSDPGVASKGFDPRNNANGAPTYEHIGYNGILGPIPAGVSDRPDGAFSDVITQHNLLDLRRHVSMNGFDYKGELQYQLQSILDGTTRTWAIDMADKQDLGLQSGDVSTIPLVCNEVGRLEPDGNPPFSGDTGRGVTIRNFDHICRRFGAQPVVERVIFGFWPGDRPSGGAQGGPVAPGLVNAGKYVVKAEDGGFPISTDSWYEGDVLHLDLAILDASTMGGLFQGAPDGGSSAAGIPDPSVMGFAPPGTTITDVLTLFHDDGHHNLLGGGGTTPVPQEVEATVVQGLGTPHLEIGLDANDTPASGGMPAGISAINITAPGTLYSPGDAIDIGPPNLPGIQATAEVTTVDGGGGILTVTITNPGEGYTVVPAIAFPTGAGNATGTAEINHYRMVGSDILGTHTTNGSLRRIFVEVEITYPVGHGLTDTPDIEVVPDATVYDGTLPGPGPMIETSTSQRPGDHNGNLSPEFREGHREVGLEYIANDTEAGGYPGNMGQPVGAVHTEEIVSRDRFDVYFPRRMYGEPGFFVNHLTVFDVSDPVSGNRMVDPSLTEFGSSSRKTVLDAGTPLYGAGQSLTRVQYFAQDPIPNFGAAGGGYQIASYFRTHAPQTAGIKEGNFLTTGDGVVPPNLLIEPLLITEDVWVGQVGMGSVDIAFPYAAPLDQIPINDGSSPSTFEWAFAATASTVIDDFDADTGLLSLQALVQADGQNVLSLGGANADELPRKDAEFRVYYPTSDRDEYRPTAMAQPLYGAVAHKAFIGVLARVVEETPGTSDGLLFRKDELVLLVLSRYAELDEESTVRFTDPLTDNRTAAAVYRTRNLLLTVGG